MKMHKLFGVLMVLACLFAGSALAAEIPLISGTSGSGGSQYNVNSGDVIYGKDIEGYYIISVNGSGNVELTLKEVVILQGGCWFKNQPGITSTSITLKLEGDNQIPMLRSEIPLTITGDGSLDCCAQGRENVGLAVCGDLTIENGTIAAEGDNFGIVTQQGKVRIEGGSLTALSRQQYDTFGAVMCVKDLTRWPTPDDEDEYDKIIELGSGNWKIEAGKDAASAQNVSNYSGEAYLHIEKLPAQDALPETDDGENLVLPETGDSANLALWISLIVISTIGMAMMLCRRKEV